MRFTHTLFVLLLSGCVGVTERYYVPNEPAFVEEGTICGTVPWARTRVLIAPNISASVDLGPRDGRIRLSLQLALPQGAQVRFVEPTMLLELPSTGKQLVLPLEPFRISVYGRNGDPGHKEQFDAGAVLDGRGRNAELAGQNTEYLKKDLFISGSSAIAELTDTLVLRFPAVEVNGVVVGAQTIPLHLVTKSGLMTCVQ